MNTLLQLMAHRPVPSIVSATGRSVGSTAVAFTEHTLPYLQWCGAAVAVVSGALGIAIAAYHLKEIYKKDWGKY